MFDVIAGHPEGEAVIAMTDRALSASTRDVVKEDLYRNGSRAAADLRRDSVAVANGRARSPKPGLVLGYSVGEVAAHAIAGSYSIEACLRLAARRAALMDQASPAIQASSPSWG